MDHSAICAVDYELSRMHPRCTNLCSDRKQIMPVMLLKIVVKIAKKS